MNEQIRFQPSVAADLHSLLSPYEEVSLVTANRIRGSIQKAFELIALFPEMYAVAFDDIRIVKIDNYPVLVQYRIVNEIPVVASVVFAGTQQ